MKVVNRSRIFEILRNHFFFSFSLYIAFTFFAIFSQEKIEQFKELMPPELMGLQIVSISIFGLFVAFSIFSLSSVVHLYKVLSSEYLRVWDDFVEGPTENGKREVLSFSQVSYAGRDLLGRFCLSAGDTSLILPGRLSVSSERIINRTISRARLKDNL